MPPKPRNWSRGKYASIVKLIGKPLKNGHAIEALRFRDFTCEPHSFMTQLYQLAKDHGMAVSCASTSTRVIYRFYDKRSPWRPNMQAFAVVIKAKREDEQS